MIFDAYAAYYDLLYTNKDYAAEARYIHDLIKLHAPTASSILDMGCGTGKHARQFAELGYQVTGVDQSASMIALAHQMNRSAAAKFECGDIRSIRLRQKFDVVLSLFHVMSYQVLDNDLQEAFATASTHLEEGGICMFDCWYAPGVLADAPTVVTKRMSNEEISVERIATPAHNPEHRTINVHFDVRVTENATGLTHELQEDHLMRYLYTQEVLEFGTISGFKLIAAHPWMSHETLAKKACWYALFVLQKQ